MVRILSLLVSTALATNTALAHGPINPSHTALLKRRAENLDLQRRISEKCGPQLARRREARLARRAARAGVPLAELHKRVDLAPRQSADNLTEGTCVLTPEVTQGPYHILGELRREAIPNVWVDAWHCNSTGYYSGYISMTGGNLSGGGSSGSGGGGGNMTNGTAPSDMAMSGSTLSTGPMTANLTATASASTSTQNAYSGADATAAAAVLNNEPTDQESFLRGTWQADADAHWTMKSIFPGWYSGRSVHFHVKVYENGLIAEKGTFIAGRAMHTGQFFFNESIVQELAALEPYDANTVTRLTNEEDMWFAYENAEGYNALIGVVYAGTNITDGLVGSIAVGLNTSYTSLELSTQWWSGNDSTTSTAGAASDAKSAFETIGYLYLFTAVFCIYL
ncbi:hypothetical protein FRC07_014570 [Ceratobasidium sp. 392]|nr:hypothetical protein FRC07_014570 [Ceratobasidium sp. 392]